MPGTADPQHFPRGAGDSNPKCVSYLRGHVLRKRMSAMARNAESSGLCSGVKALVDFLLAEIRPCRLWTRAPSPRSMEVSSCATPGAARAGGGVEGGQPFHKAPHPTGFWPASLLRPLQVCDRPGCGALNSNTPPPRFSHKKSHLEGTICPPRPCPSLRALQGRAERCGAHRRPRHRHPFSLMLTSKMELLSTQLYFYQKTELASPRMSHYLSDDGVKPCPKG